MLQDFRKFIYHPMDVEEFEKWWDEFKCDHKIIESDLAEIGTRKAKDMWLLQMYDLRSMSYPVLRPKPSTHTMCAQESSLHTYRIENGYRITNVLI
jgi:hypothetical protein